MKTTKQLLRGFLAFAIFGIVGFAAALPSARHTQSLARTADAAAKSHCAAAATSKKSLACAADRVNPSSEELHTTMLPEIHVVPDAQ